MKSRSQESCAPADPARAHGSTEAKEHGCEKGMDSGWKRRVYTPRFTCEDKEEEIRILEILRYVVKLMHL